MSILRAIQKKNTETGGESAPRNIIAFDPSGRRKNMPPDSLLDDEFKIGTPSSAFMGQPGSAIGTALPDIDTEQTAGAKLNAETLTRSSVRRLPDFVSWTVDAERVEPRLVAITNPHSGYCEEYRSLRTHILHKGERSGLKSIVAASVNPGEGKTITAINLAWMLAQTDATSALLIDADLRMPSLADYLGIETEKGLSDVLAGTASLAECIIRLEPSGLCILPGGEARQDVAELISGPRFKDILAEAREMFDFTVIDVPPLEIFTDATVLINQADAAILVVRANRTRYSQIDRVLEPLPKDRFLGVVLNHSEDVMAERYAYEYYNYQKLNEVPIAP
jgi:capsular exopolysaccharide synthesis family protein